MVEASEKLNHPRKRSAGFRIIKEGDEPLLESLRRIEESFDILVALAHETKAEHRRIRTLLKWILSILFLMLLCTLGLVVLR